MTRLVGGRVAVPVLVVMVLVVVVVDVVVVAVVVVLVVDVVVVVVVVVVVIKDGCTIQNWSEEPLKSSQHSNQSKARSDQVSTKRSSDTIEHRAVHLAALKFNPEPILSPWVTVDVDAQAPHIVGPDSELSIGKHIPPWRSS